jgi:hypothetical protein
MKKAVWIAGQSAAGKYTFIRYLLSQPNSKIISKLGWGGASVAVCNESIQFIGQKSGDANERNRYLILESAQRILRTNDIALIKWQITDSENHYPQRLKQMLPDFKHEVVYLQVSRETLKTRLIKKLWWNMADKPNEWIEKESLKVQEKIDDLKESDFKINLVDSNTLNYFLCP